jgi:HemY protein
MIRILTFILWIAFFAAALTILAAAPGTLGAEAFGWRFDLPVGAAFGALFLLAALLIGATSLTKDALAAPRQGRARKETGRREKGVLALTKSLEALAAGDAVAAKKNADLAMKTLGAAPVARLLAAQAMRLKGDEAAAGEALAGMLAAPETEFLALRELYAKARRESDVEAAKAHAARAFDLHPRARWAFDAVFDLALDRDDYAAVAAAIERAEKAGGVEAASAARGIAACLTAAAYSRHASDDHDGALADAEAALRRAQGFTPAAVLAARLHHRRGERRKADKILAEAFSRAPARAIGDAVIHHYSDESVASRAEALERLAEKNPPAREAALLYAAAMLLRKDAAGAARLLEEILRVSATQQPLRMMAEAQGALHGDAAARVWLERAAAAPREAELSDEAFFRLSPDAWRRLVRTFMETGRFAPEPLEGAPAGLEDEAFFLPAASLAPALPADTAPPTVAATADGARATDDQEADEALDREVAAARGVN